MESEDRTDTTTDPNKWNISSFVLKLRNYFDGNSNKTEEKGITEYGESIEANEEGNIEKNSVQLSSIIDKSPSILERQDLLKDEVMEDNAETLQKKAGTLVEAVQNLAEATKVKLPNVVANRVLLEGEEMNTEDNTKRKQTHKRKSEISIQQTKCISANINPHKFAETLKTKLQNVLAQEEHTKSPNANFIKSLKRSFETILDDNKPSENMALFGSLYNSVKLASLFRVSDNDPPTTSVGCSEKFQCKYCFENFVHISNLISHAQTHSRDKPYQCKICAENFPNVLHLKLHLKEHSDKKPFSCKFCPKKFAYYTDMMTHKTAAHRGDKAFQCDVCGRYFKMHCRLKVHSKIHTRKFRCEICGNSYMEKLKLARHLQRHLDSKPFQCSICKQKFIQKPVLIAHMKTHDSETE